MDKTDIFNRLTDLDQALAGISSTGKLTAAYYTAMIEDGMPKDVALYIIRDWSSMFLLKQLWPDHPPQGNREV